MDGPKTELTGARHHIGRAASVAAAIAIGGRLLSKVGVENNGRSGNTSGKLDTGTTGTTGRRPDRRWTSRLEITKDWLARRKASDGTALFARQLPRRKVPNAAPKIAAVTVTYNSMDVLEDFLASVMAQTGSWSLVIVDNQSTDGTRDRLAAITDDRIHVILNDRNTGFAAGTNVGIRLGRAMGAESILLVNNDTHFGPDTFERLSDKLRSSGAEAISPVIVFDHDPDKIWYAGGGFEWRTGIRNTHDHYDQSVAVAGPDDFDAEFCPACFMMFDARTFDCVGLLDEDFFVYWEDGALCWKMKLAGCRIVVTPSIVIQHKASVLTGGFLSDFSLFEQHKNKVIFLRKFTSGLTYAYQLLAVTGRIGGSYVRGSIDAAGARHRLRGLRAGLSY